MTRPLRLRLALLAAGAGLLVAAGFAQSAGTAGATRKGGTLRLASFEDVGYVDTALGYTPIPFAITYATCAKLFNHPDAEGAEGARVVPEVVDRYTISRDRRTYDFELRRTYRFHTGARVTARSFADAFNRDAAPSMQSYATTYMREIEGAQAVIDGNATSISGIRVLGPYRLQIRLTKPVGDFTARLTLPFFCPVLPNTPVDPKGIDDPAGSGPYYVAERIVNQRVVLKRNPFYRGGRPANVDQVVWTAGESRESCLLAVQEDRIDHCYPFGFPPTAVEALADRYGINRPGGQFFVNPGLGLFYFAFNHDRPAFRGRDRSRSRRRSTTRSIGPRSSVRSATSWANARTRSSLTRSGARRASTHWAGRISPPRDAGTRGLA
jgi:ABC-type oligopeptide transport system substrate-binding subunit